VVAGDVVAGGAAAGDTAAASSAAHAAETDNTIHATTAAIPNVRRREAGSRMSPNIDDALEWKRSGTPAG
jgi:hypothetical protein